MPVFLFKNALLIKALFLYKQVLYELSQLAKLLKNLKYTVPYYTVGEGVYKKGATFLHPSLHAFKKMKCKFQQGGVSYYFVSVFICLRKTLAGRKGVRKIK